MYWKKQNNNNEIFIWQLEQNSFHAQKKLQFSHVVNGFTRRTASHCTYSVAIVFKKISIVSELLIQCCSHWWCSPSDSKAAHDSSSSASASEITMGASRTRLESGLLKGATGKIQIKGYADTMPEYRKAVQVMLMTLQKGRMWKETAYISYWRLIEPTKVAAQRRAIKWTPMKVEGE